MLNHSITPHYSPLPIMVLRTQQRKFYSTLQTMRCYQAIDPVRSYQVSYTCIRFISYSDHIIIGNVDFLFTSSRSPLKIVTVVLHLGRGTRDLPASTPSLSRRFGGFTQGCALKGRFVLPKLPKVWLGYIVPCRNGSYPGAGTFYSEI